MKSPFLTFDFEIKSLDEKTGMFEGYASTFGNVDLGGDMVMPGAFKKTIRENKGKFPILADHDPSRQIGWNHEASEDEKGLLVKGELLVDDIPDARAKRAIMKKALELKTSAGLSIGYRAIRWSMDEDKTTQMRYRKLQELKLFEYSVVTFPMNTEAIATAAKHWLDELQAAKDGSEIDHLNNFVAKMIENGFNESNIKSALETAAAQIKTPGLDYAHLFDQGIKALKTT